MKTLAFTFAASVLVALMVTSPIEAAPHGTSNSSYGASQIGNPPTARGSTSGGSGMYSQWSTRPDPYGTNLTSAGVGAQGGVPKSGPGSATYQAWNSNSIYRSTAPAPSSGVVGGKAQTTAQVAGRGFSGPEPGTK